jgi:hypothetical protein
MKQIAIVGDLARWKQEVEFITEMLHFTATRVVTVNIGMRSVTADLNRLELRKLFPGDTLADSVGIAVSKLYSQGIADGILGLVHNDSSFFSALNKAFEGLPFGTPKVALVAGDSAWRGQKDIVLFHLPGTAYNLNPVIKITLCNAVFAISGMSLCNVHNFGSANPLIGVICCQEEAGKSLADQGLNYIEFGSWDGFVNTLIRNGYINGMKLCREFEGFKGCIEAAMTREIPVVIASKDSEHLRGLLESIEGPMNSPVALIIPEPQGSLFSLRPAATKTPTTLNTPHWLKLQPISHQFGTPPFFRAAAKTLIEMLK